MDPGSKLGPYEIRDKLGEGGMGAVYLAEDRRLGRRVAIKVLPEEFASDPERCARFEREARAAAALNHPHIAAVHDVGAEGDTHYLVQEYLEGETLRERLDRGGMPLQTALTLGAEIAEALDAAHEAGIVHRDLKPDNVFVTEQGHAKVLDFGLAKLTEKAMPQAGDSTRSPTVLGTSAGAMMGTAGYMAPEQITGEAVDERADVFAFGCLLYEMVSGRRAFEGKNLPEILHRLANDDPQPLEEVAPGLPSEGRRIIDKCLAKEPARRYQGMADLTVDLRRLIADVDAGKAAAGPTGQAATGRRPSPSLLLVTGLAGLVVGALLYAGFARGPASRSADRRSFYLPLEGVEGLSDANWSQMAISPDGRWLGFATGEGPASIIDLAEADSLRTVPDSDDALSPFFSPDGRWFGFVGSDQRLYRMPVDGGRPQPFTERLGVEVASITWRESGELLIQSTFAAPVMRVPAGSDRAEILFDLRRADGEIGHGFAMYLPDDRRLLYSFWDDDWKVGVHDLDSGERLLLTEGYGARYTPSGHMVWILGGQMMAARFDPETLELGEPIQLLEGVEASPGWGRPAYQFTAGGSLAYLRGPDDVGTALIRVASDGTRSVIRPGDRTVTELEYSPAGDRLALSVVTPEGDNEVWSYDLERDDLAVIGRDVGWDHYPFFSPTGDRIAFVSERLGDGEIFIRSADGGGQATPMVVGPGYPQRPTWTRPERILSWWVSPGTTNYNLVMFPLDALGEPVELSDSPATESWPMLSHDGRFLAYASDRSERADLYVAEFAGGAPGQEWKITTGGGIRPRWTRDDGSIYYWNKGRVLRLEVLGTAPFRTGPPEVVTEAQKDSGWDVAPDGSHVLVVEALPPPRPRLVLNWFAELERRLPPEN